MKKLLFAALLLAAPRVHAQDASEKRATESSEGNRPTSDEESKEVKDPTQHFNFTNVHYSGKDEYGGAFGDGKETTPDGKTLDEEEPMSPPFIFLLVNFALLLIILAKYGAPAARKLAEDRHDQIKTALDDAARLRDQAAAKLAELKKKVDGVDAEIKKLVDGIRTDAEADKARILEAAAAQAAQMKRDAEQRIAAEIDLARHQLTKEVSVAATNATEKLLRDKATPEDQRKLVGNFISSVETQPGARS